jgi:hemoglobin
MGETLYEKYGGGETVRTLVNKFYQKVLSTSILIPYFENVDMDDLMDHQTRFISQVLGGPVTYDGDILKKAHGHLNITEDAFGAVACCLQETLEQLGVQEGDVTAIMTIVGKAKDQVVTG